MYNRRYDKVFLMLRQETAGYSMGQRAPWGSCVMEIKNGAGRIILSVQSLRPIHRGRYAVYAIAGEGETQNNFFCGVLVPDAAGHGELKWDFNPDNVEGEDVAVEKLNTVAILAESDGGFSAPLVAYVAEKVDWRTYFIMTSNKKARPTEISRREQVKIELAKKETAEISKKEIAKVEVKPKQFALLEVEENDATLVAAEAAIADVASFSLPKVNWNKDDFKQKEEQPKEKMRESHHGDFRGLLERFRHELKDLQETGVFTDSDMDRIAKAGRRNTQKEDVIETTSSNVSTESVAKAVEPKKMEFVEKPTKTMMEATKDIETSVEKSTEFMLEDVSKRYSLLMNNVDIIPFVGETKNWKCISLEEMVLLDKIPMSWLKDYFFLLVMKKYHHFIWAPDGEGYFLGVPGQDTAEERAKADALGFQEFKKMENRDMGYWIFVKK